LRARPGGRLRRGLRGVSAFETRFASRMGNILGLVGGRASARGNSGYGVELLHCNNNYGSAARAKCDQNG
jgi:hypothetical protein